jgi:hypothetical protein
LRKKNKLDISAILADNSNYENINLNFNMNLNQNQNQEMFKGELQEIDQNILLQYSALIPYIQEEGLKKVMSKHVLAREDGLNLFIGRFEEIISLENDNLIQLINHFLKLLLYLFNETHPQITARIIELFSKFLKKIDQMGKKQKLNFDINNSVSIFVKIREKLGDVNSKIRNKVIFFYLELIKSNFPNYNYLISELLEEEFKHFDTRKVLKSSNIINGKLTIFSGLLNGLNKKDLIDNINFPTQLILNYSLENLSHQKVEIRKLSRKIILKINEIFGYKRIENEIKNISEKDLELLIKDIPEMLNILIDIRSAKLKSKVINYNTRILSGKKEGKKILEKIDNKKKSEEKINIQKKQKYFLNKISIELDKDKEKEKEIEKENKINIDNKKDIKTNKITIKALNSKENKNEEENLTKGKKEKEKGLIKVKQIMCNFCGRSDKKFKKQEDIENHIKNECVVFTNCIKCKNNIEVRLLNEHKFNECEYKSCFIKCEKCKEPILEEDYDTHKNEGNCNPCKKGKDTNRCPLCHNDVLSIDRGLTHHLVDQGCKGNKRK